MDKTSLADLVNQAERLTAEISCVDNFPRVERNLKQLAEAGHELWARTSKSTTKSDADVKASILLGSRGYDLQRVTQKLDSLTERKPFPNDPMSYSHVEADMDVSNYLKNERETAIASIISEIKTSTLDRLDQIYWEKTQKDWDEDKKLIMGIGLPQDDTPLKRIVDQNRPSTSASSPVVSNNQIVESVMRAVRSGGDFTSIIGSYREDGTKIAGTANMSPQLLEEVACKCEKEGFIYQAAVVFDLAEFHTRAIEMISKLLAMSLAKDPEQIHETARSYALRYSTQGYQVKKDVMKTFNLLVDLRSFFECFNKGAYTEALDYIESIGVVPFNTTQIDARVRDFNSFTSEIQRNIPEVLSASMKTLHNIFLEVKSVNVRKHANIKIDMGDKRNKLAMLKEKARCLLVFAGTLPYRMTGERNAQLVHLDSLMTIDD